MGVGSSAAGEPEDRRFQWDDGRLTFGIGAVLLLICTVTRGIVYENHLELHWSAALVLDWVRDLGIAFIVGGIVSFGIERISRQRFVSEAAVSRANFFGEVRAAHQAFLTADQTDRTAFLAAADAKITGVKTNFFNAAVLRNYPPEFSLAVMEPLEKTKFFKTGLNITVDLLRPEPGHCHPFDDAIVHEITSSYHALNISSQRLTVQPRMFADDMGWDKCPAELLEWRVGDKHLRGTDLTALKSIDDPDGTDTSHIWYKFPHPTEIDPGKSVFVLSRIRTIKHTRDTTTWCGLQPAGNLTFIVNHPADFEAYIQQKTSSRSVEGPVQSDGKRVTVQIFTPLMPYMTMEYGWREKHVATPAAIVR